MTSGSEFGQRWRATVASVGRLAARIRVRRWRVRTELMGDHLRRDVGLLDGRATVICAEQAAGRRD